MTGVYICTDINECEVEEPCLNADCVNVNGSYTCGPCFHGYVPVSSQNSQSSCCKLSHCPNQNCLTCRALADCSNGNVRLTNNSVPSTNIGEGRVEICHDNVYGIVCANRWDSIDAGVVCRQLGYNFTGNGI